MKFKETKGYIPILFKALKHGECGRGGLIGYLRLVVGVPSSSPSRFQTLIVAQATRLLLCQPPSDDADPAITRCKDVVAKDVDDTD